MSEFSPPVVAASGSADRRGRSSSSSTVAVRTSGEIMTLARHLPEGPAYLAVRAPIAEGPVPDSRSDRE